ncbi:hypothetical protein LA080_010789 [Diaporthe eres]|nr:hypothetical protein LA080_010789 [Diaporthe eres]
MRNTVPEQQVSSEATSTCQQTDYCGRLDSVVFESLHSHPSDGIRAHHKSVLRPGYRCMNNGRDDEAAVPRLCIKKDRTSQGGRTIGRGYERKARDAIHPPRRPSPSLAVRDYLRSELAILLHHHSVSEPDKRVNHGEWQKLHDKSRLEFGRGRSFSANAGQ